VAAVASALLILLYPTVLIGTLVRFYALQGLLFWMGTALLYRLVAEGRARLGSALLAALALLLLAAGSRLQVVTLIGLAGFAAWAALYLTWRLRDAVPRVWLVLGWVALLLAGGLAAFALAQSGFGMRLIETYRSASLWAEQDRNNVLFYYYLLAKQYGVLGNYLPLAALAAFAFYPRPALYCTIVLGLGLLLHSFGGMKQDATSPTSCPTSRRSGQWRAGRCCAPCATGCRQWWRRPGAWCRRSPRAASRCCWRRC
jgi:hypothetical protein